MEESDLVKHIKHHAALESEKSTKGLYRGAAIFGAASCLAEAEAKEITDPIEQVKYLHKKFLHDRLIMQWIPWAWLKHCVDQKLISKLPKEDWAIAVCIGGSHLEGNPALALQFIDLKK